MTLAPGVRFGAYDVVAILGSGGMGTVYRARDSKLNRDVALKVMSDLFASDPDRLARFRREAHVLASLNHPNIGAIYGLEEANGVTALVLELVDGPTLADRIEQGPIPVDEALPMAKQLADALEVAHEQGIVHRDLKPANIKLRPDGTIKVLDFGLAKAVSNEPLGTPSGELSQSPTMTNRGGTIAGVILGTAAYMSPEQSRGRAVDRRTDIWAFGCVLYEMVTGKAAFAGGDVSEILAAIIKSEPDWNALPTELPPATQTLLRRCLHKDPKQRVRDIGDVRLALEGAFETSISGPKASPRSYVAIFTAVALLVGLAGLAVWSFNQLRQQDARTAARFAIELPAPVALPGAVGLNRSNVIQPVAISPDGRRIIFLSGGRSSRALSPQLYSRSLDQLDWIPIKGAEAATSSLFVSADSRWVGFEDTSDQTIKKLPLNGAPSATICKWPGGIFRGASWGENDSIVFATTAAPGLMQVPAAGGIPVPLTSPQNEIHLTPQFLPGAHAVAFTVRRPGEPDRVGIVSIDTHEQRTLLDGSAPHYAMSGHLVFWRDAALWAVPFDPNRLQITGDAIPVLQDIEISGGSPTFDLSRDGSLVYVPRGLTKGPSPPSSGSIGTAGKNGSRHLPTATRRHVCRRTEHKSL